jgi:hypothetical protein
MKRIILTILLSASTLCAETELRIYPISKRAVEFIRFARTSSDSEPQAPSHAFFAEYGIQLGSKESSLSYDGESLAIRETKENHEKIGLILRVVEDMVRSAQNQKLISTKSE